MQSVAGFGGISGRNEKNGGEAEEAGDSSPLSPSQHRRVPITYVGGGSAKLKKGASLDAEAGPTCARTGGKRKNRNFDVEAQLDPLY